MRAAKSHMRQLPARENTKPVDEHSEEVEHIDNPAAEPTQVAEIIEEPKTSTTEITPEKHEANVEIARRNYLKIMRAYNGQLEGVTKKREMIISQTQGEKFYDDDVEKVMKKLDTKEKMLRTLDEEEATIKTQFDTVKRWFDNLKTLKSCWNIE